MGNRISKKKNIMFKLMAICAICLSALLGISACTWFENDTPTGDSNYDANGKLRIMSENVSLIKPGTDNSVSENTGLFEWTLNYYMDMNSNADDKDQSLLSQMYDQSNYNLLYNEIANVDSNNQPNDTETSLAIRDYLTTIYKSGTEYPLDNDGSFKCDNKNIYILFPTYTISISGITYQIKVDVDYTNLKIVVGKNGLLELKDSNSIPFTTSYRIGTSGEWKTDYKMAKVVKIDTEADNTNSTAGTTADNKGDQFKILFNPMLSKGSTNRYIRVKSIPNVNSSLTENSSRGSSIYTSPVTFNVYKQTFKLSCNNSSVASYEGLTYDNSNYYFSTKEERSDTAYSSLTGYFVEGRIVEVSRFADKSGDFAFQSWTVNGKADNSKTIKSTTFVDGYPSDLNSEACLNPYSINTMGIKAVKYVDNTEDETSKAVQGDITKLNNVDKLYYESITSNSNYYEGKLYSVACSNTASNVFYCNLAKIRNFILAGTLYDGENFFSNANDALLQGVDIYIWQDTTLLAKYGKNGLEQVPSNGNEESSNNSVLSDFLISMGIAKYTKINDIEQVDIDESLEQWASNISMFNGQFSVGNLAYNCSISFGKYSETSQSTNTTSTPTANQYTFYSTSMTKTDDDISAKLCVKISDDSYSDRLGNTIIGTRYTADNKVEVNIFYETEAGLIEGSKYNATYNGVQYQIISTTQEETDVFGYTTSKVIISLLLPTNASLTGYNVESINSICKILYEGKKDDESDYILCDVGYNETTRKNTFTYYEYTEDELNSGVSDGNTLNCLMYNGNFYQYSHRDYTNSTYNYYYAYDYDKNGTFYREVIVRQESESGETKYVLQKYTRIDSGLNNSAIPTPNEDGIITVSHQIKYNDCTYTISKTTGESKVSILATAYKTDLKYNPNGTETESSYNMYVYYNIVDYSVNNKTTYYYTAPLGLKTDTLGSVDTGEITTATEIKWFQQELNYLPTAGDFERSTNNSTLVYDSVLNFTPDEPLIMLGADILDMGSKGSIKSTNELLAYNFFKATGNGKNIISNHYYYIKPLGDSAQLLVSQYVNTNTTTTLKDQTVFYLGDKLYTGNVTSKDSDFKFAFISSYVDANGKTHTIEYNPDDKTIKIDGKKEDGEFYTSMNNGTIYSLYHNGSYSIEKCDFIEQEKDNKISNNISVVTKNELPYISKRECKEVKISNETDNTKTSLNLTIRYHIYTCNTSTGEICDYYLCYDDNNFYIESGSDKDFFDTETKKLYKGLIPLTNSGGILTTSDGKFVASFDSNLQLQEYSGYKTKIVYEYYDDTQSENSLYVAPLGNKYIQTIGQINNESFETLYSLTGNIIVAVVDKTTTYYGEPPVDYLGTTYDIDGKSYVKLTKETKTIEVEASKNSIVRQAVIKSTGEDVHLLGKVVLLGNAEFDVYPSFSYYMQNSDKGILHINNGKADYYNVDYTTIDNVIQGFPGVKIFSGAPYVNPIMFFEVKHKADEKAVVDIGLEITNGYYVEVIANAIDSTQNNLIYDFSTVTFKDTITNLTSNDYIDRMYYVLDKSSQKSIVAYVKVGTTYQEYLGGTPLTIQNIGINDNDPYVYAITSKNESGLYVDKLYITISTDQYEELKYENLIIWQSSTVKLEDIPTFDAHNYYISDNGLYILTSDAKDNEVCSKLEDLFISGVGSANSAYDYNEVLIGGFTSAFRVNASQLENISSLQAFWKEDAINISNNYNFGDPYFLTGKEGVVLVANPVVTLNQDGSNIIYAFKRWAIYGRYNSEILYYNAELSNSHHDSKSAIMRFTSQTAGYYVFMPIYERIYSIDLGTTIKDGSLNMGGSISITYDQNSGDSINLDKSYYGDNAQDIYFVEMIKTSQNDITQYYYSDLEITPFLYFTGEFYEDNDNTPIFEYRDDIVQVKVGKYYYYYMCVDGKIVNVKQLTTLERYKACIVPITTSKAGGYYTFEYTIGYDTTKYTNISYNSYLTSAKKEIDNGKEIYVNPNGTTAKSIGELLCFGYSVNYYYDGVGTSKNHSKVVVYNKDDKRFYAIENGRFSGLSFGDNEYNSSNEWLNKLMSETSTEVFATLINKKYNSINKAYGDTYYNIMDSNINMPADFVVSNSFYISKLAGLYSGELYSHKEGTVDVINTTQQFKSSYFTRDTRMIISAKADAGYRLNDWYLVEYNEKTKSFVKSNTPLSQVVTATYDDIIRKVHYNPYIGTNGTWYWITSNCDEIKRTDASGKTTTYYIYYSDADKTTQAIVPNNMLDDVCGYYAETSEGIWMPVYRKNSTSGDWYFDESCTIAYSGDASKIQLKSHFDCIRQFNDGTQFRYLLGNVEVYKNNGNYYRTKDLGNMVLKDGKIFIYNLHSNIKVVAEFIEVYQSFVLTDNPDEDNVETVALYYTGVRSDTKGNTLTDLQDKQVENQETIKEDFKYKHGDNEITGINSVDDHYIGANNYNSFIELPTSNNSPLYKAMDTNGQTAKVDLVNMRFDVGSTIYIIVKVHYDRELTIHSLGMNSEYQITPVLYPKDDYINSNKNAEADKRDEHYFYIFKVTFNRDLAFYYNDGIKNSVYLSGDDAIPEDVSNLTSTIGDGNFNPEYVVHVNRKKSIVADVLNGNYSEYYSKLFNFYDKDGNKVELAFNDNNYVRLADSYLETFKTNYLKDNDIDIPILETEYFPNIKDLFTKLRDDYGINFSFAYVEEKDATEDKKPLKSVNEIFAVISKKFLKTDKEMWSGKKNIITAPQQSGSINFINLSCVPVYTYTTSIKVLSNIKDDVTFDSGENSMETVFNQLGVKLIEKLYTRGGYYGYTYIGVGEKDKTTSSISIDLPGNKTVTYTNKFTNETISDQENIGMFDQEYALAKDTVMVLEGIGKFDEDVLKEEKGVWYVKIDTVKYIFTGWYEQKKVVDKNGNSVWGDLQFMSNSLTQPFESTAYADTNIIALFERAVDVSFENKDENSFTANFNVQKDSLNNTIQVKTQDQKTIISGTFTISTNLKVDITPTGGYRLNNNWKFNPSTTDISNLITFRQYNDKNQLIDKNFSDLNLVETTQFEFVVGKLLAKTTKNNSDSSTTSDEIEDIMSANNRKNSSLTIDINLVPVQLTYIYIEGYATSNGNTNSGAGIDFLLYDYSYNSSTSSYSSLVETVFENGNVKNNVQGKDSAQRNIIVQLDGNNLAIYGYFDTSAYNGRLVLVANFTGSATLDGWYVNGYEEKAQNIDGFPNHSRIQIGEHPAEFRIWYTYNENLYGNENAEKPDKYGDNAPTEEERETTANNLNGCFNLNENNAVYFLKAKIEAKSTMNVAYATIDSLEEISYNKDNHINKGDKSATGVVSNSLGLISWTGAKFDTQTSSSFSANGEELFWGKEENTYYFNGKTKVTLSNNTLFYEANGNIYKFIGWFEYRNETLSLVSETVTYSTTAGGYYVAIFAKMIKIDAYTQTNNGTTTTQNSNGTIHLESDSSSNKIDKKLANGSTKQISLQVYCSKGDINYAIIGGTIKITTKADNNYLVTDVCANSISILEDDQKDLQEISTSYKIIGTSESEIEIIAHLSRGYYMNVIQLYYDSVAMKNTADKIDINNNPLITIEKQRNGAENYSVLNSNKESYCFTYGTKIKLTFNSDKVKNQLNLGLIGFFVNTATTSNEYRKTQVELTITEDLIVEVRTTQYVRIDPNSYALQQDGNSLSKLNAPFTITYQSPYTNDTNTYDTKTLNPKNDTAVVLNGTILTLKADNNAQYAFIEWRKNAKDTNDITLSSDTTYNYSAEYPYQTHTNNNTIQTIQVKAIFRGSRTVTIKKEMGQMHINDMDIDVNDLWSKLDVIVEYYDAYSSNPNDKITTNLGGIKELNINVADGSEVTINVAINKSHENMYSAKLEITQNGNTTINNNTARITSTATITATFYAKRNVTLVRQVDNIEKNQGELAVEFGIAVENSEDENTQGLGDEARKTWPNVQYGKKWLFVKAKIVDNYTFAGFRINNQIVGKGEEKNGFCYFYIDYPEDSSKNGTTVGNTLYTYDSDLIITALWYTTSSLNFSVTVDGVDILGKDLSENLFVTVVGNLITAKNNNTYNTTLQAEKVTSSNKDKLSALTSSNLALIASNYAGYQFVGFYYSSNNKEETKLDFYSKDNNYNFGNTLTSMIEGLETGTYTITAKYLTAWQVGTQISLTESNNVSQLNAELTTGYFYQVNKKDNKWVIVDNNNYDIYPVKQNYNTYHKENYFYPYYSNYIAVYLDVNEVMKNSTTAIGYYINGIYIKPTEINVALDGKEKEFVIIDLTKVNGFATNNEFIKENGLFAFNNMVIERKFVKNVNYVVRIGVNDIGDTSKLTQDDFNDIEITINYKNPYTEEEEEPLTLTNTGPDSYWKKDSIYYKLPLPIGTSVSTTINANEINKNILNGWYVYRDHAVANSTSVINYTNTVDFVLTDDTDIIAQYRPTKSDNTTDTQFSYLFNGQDFTDGGLYSPATQGGPTDLSVIAESLTLWLKGCVETTKAFNKTISGLGNDKLTISSEDGIIFTIQRKDTTERKFMFMGWYQEIKDSNNPSKYLFVTNKLGLGYTEMPRQMANASNMTAIFTQIIELELGYGENEHKNSIIYTNFKQSYSQFAPTLMDDYTSVGKNLFTKITPNGTLVINTLFNSYIWYKYTISNGYHINDITNSDKNNYNEFNNYSLPVVENNISSALKYMGNGEVHQTTYNYKFTSKDYIITSIESTFECKTHPKQSSSTSSASIALADEVESNTTSTALLTCEIDEDFGKMVTTNCNASSQYNQNSNSAISLLLGNIEFVDTSSVSSYIGAIIKGCEDLGDNDVKLYFTIKLPDGTIITETISNNQNFLLKEEGNPRKLPIGTTIALTVENNNLTKVLDFIRIYYVDDPAPDEFDFESQAFKSQGFISLETSVSKDKETSASATFDISSTYENKINNKYLIFVINYKTIYNLELTENDPEQGSVIKKYNNENSNTDSMCPYTLEIKTTENFAFDDFDIAILENEYKGLKDILLNFVKNGSNYSNNIEDNNFINLYELLTSEITKTEYTNGGYKFTLDVDVDNSTFTLTCTDKDSTTKYYSIVITDASYSEQDSAGRQYINNVSVNFNLYTDMKIKTKYLHVAHVDTNSVKESFDTTAKSNNYITREVGDIDTLYIYDYEFSHQQSGEYIFITKLNDFYKISNLDTEKWDFVGYYYSGKILKKSANDENDNTITVEKIGDYISDRIIIEAVYMEKLKSDIRYYINYYNDEIGYEVENDTNPSALGTPTTDLKFKVNNTDLEENTITTGLHQTSDVTITDTNNYFSFTYWQVKYNGTYLQTENNNGWQNFKLESSALCVNSSLYITLINLLNNNENKKLIGEDGIDISKFEFEAYLTEEVVEIEVNYEKSGEQFKISFERNGSTFGDDWLTTPDNLNKTTLNKTTLNQNSINFLIRQEDSEESTTYRLRIAYSKNLCTQGITINIIARSYTSRKSCALAKTTDDSKVREILNNGEYSNSTYLKLNGFKDMLGKLECKTIDDQYYALSLETGKATHTTSYWLDTTPLYLIEFGMATGNQTASIDDNIELKITNGNGTITLGSNYSLETGDQYAGWSLLFEEGSSVTIKVINTGKFEWADNPNNVDPNFRGIAISENFTMSDIYAKFKKEFSTILDPKILDPEILDADLDDWKKVLGITTEDGQNSFYQTLSQYSEFNLPKQTTSYTFIAHKNMSFIADYLGIFKTQKQYISAIIGSDNSIEYENTGKVNGSYSGDNFIFVVAPKDTTILLDRVDREDIKYTEQTDNTVIKDSNGDILKQEDITKGSSSESGTGTTEGQGSATESGSTQSTPSKIHITTTTSDKSKTQIQFVTQSKHLSLGIVADRYVTSNISVLYKYLTLNEDILKDLSIETSKRFMYNWLDPNYSETDESVEGSDTGSAEGSVAGSQETTSNAYIIDLSKYNNISIEKYLELAESDKDNNYPLTTTINTEKNSKVVLLAKNIPGYVFVGFKLVSTTTKLNPGELFQGITTKKSIYTTNDVDEELNINSIESYNYNYATINNLHGNISVVALYEPIIYILNITHKAFNEYEALNNTSENGDTFKPNPYTDEDTTYGKITAPSLVISSGQTIELKISTKGFSEYKGMTIGETGGTINALYCVDNNIVIPDLNSTLDEETESVDHTYTIGQITSSKLFTSKYSTRQDDAFVQNENSISYLYIQIADNLSSDINLYAYFSSLYYTMNIQIGEMQSSLSEENDKIQNSVYVAYSQEYMSTPGWVNPSADTKTGKKYGIANNDPYIYTFVDNNGKLLANPTRITAQLFVSEYDEENKYLVLQSNNGEAQLIRTAPPKDSEKGYSETESTILATFEKGDKSLPTWSISYASKQLKNAYNYIEVAGTYQDRLKFKNGLFALNVNGVSYDSGDLNLENFELSYSSDNEDESNSTIKISNISIGEYAMIDVIMDLSTGSITIKLRVFADPNSGFPDVGVSRPQSTTDEELVSMSSARVLNDPNASNGMDGFGDVYFADAIIADENGNLVINREQYPNGLVLDAEIIFQIFAKRVSATVNFGELGASYLSSGLIIDDELIIDLTNPDHKDVLDTLGTKYHEATESIKMADLGSFQICPHCGQSLNCTDSGHTSMIDAYNLYIIKNAYSYVEALENALKDGRISKEYYVKFCSSLLSFNPAYGDENLNTYYGSIFDYIDFSKAELQANLSSCGYDYLAKKLDYTGTGADLTFRKINIYDNFVKGINPLFYDNCVLYGDMVVTMLKLTEHTAPHTVETAFDTDAIWREDPAYKYINYAKSSWGVEQDGRDGRQGVGNITYYYDSSNNMFENITNSSTNVEIDSFQKVINYLAGIFSGDAKYRGTFNKFIHSAIIPSRSDYYKENSIAFTSTTTVNLSDTKINVNDKDFANKQEGRIVTERLQKTHADILTFVVEVVATSAVIALVAITTGPIGLIAGLVVGAAIVINDGIVVFSGYPSATDTLPIYQFINNLDLGFD